MQEISEEIFRFYLNKIDISKLKRDYQKFPLKKIGRKREIPFKEDLEYLFLELNFPVRILQKYLKCDEQMQLKWFKDLDVKRKSYELRTISAAEFSKLLTGYEFPFQNPKTLQKRKLNSIEKYGVDNPTKLKEVKEKNLATRKQHSLEDPNYSLKIKEKFKQTCLKNFGVENPSQSKEIQQKKIKTCQKNFGVNFPMQSKIVLDKSKLSIEQKISENPNYRFSIQLKSTKTKIEKGTINSSKTEDLIYEKLKEKFQDVKRQYRVDKRYPFNCDFYIPSLDLFIEFQGSWMHGYHQFDKNCKEDLEKLKTWKERFENGKPQYKSAMIIWTEKDPMKRETARKNHLNLLEFFSFRDFENWINKRG